MLKGSMYITKTYPRLKAKAGLANPKSVSCIGHASFAAHMHVRTGFVFLAPGGCDQRFGRAFACCLSEPYGQGEPTASISRAWTGLRN